MEIVGVVFFDHSVEAGLGEELSILVIADDLFGRGATAERRERRGDPLEFSARAKHAKTTRRHGFVPSLHCYFGFY